MRPIHLFLSWAVCLTACVASGADIQLNVTQPTAGAIASAELAMRVSIASLYELSSVTAQVDGRQTNLVYSAAVGAWTNSLTLSGLSYGQKILTVSAQDVFGGTAQTQRVFLVDNPPTLTIVAPLNDTVSTGQVYVEATASDDGPAGVIIKVFSPFIPTRPLPVITGTNSVRGFVGTVGGLVTYSATDSSGQVQWFVRRVILEKSSNLVEAVTAPGQIMDFTGSRLLFSVSPDIPVPYSSFLTPGYELFGKPEPRILDRDSGQAISASAALAGSPYLSGVTDSYIASGFLASTGALLVDAHRGLASNLPPQLIVWQETNATMLGVSLVDRNSIRLVGTTTLLRNFGLVVLQDIVRTNQQYALSFPVGTSIMTAGLPPNLDLVYAVSNHVFRNRAASPDQPYANRMTTQLTSREIGTLLNIDTDGINVVFNEYASNQSAIQIITFAGEQTLAVWPGYVSSAFQVRNGWAAFTKPGTAGQTQIWTRSPSGALLQRTFFGNSSTLESLGPNGEVTFLFNFGRYVSLPGAQPWWVNSTQGQVRWQDGKFLIILGRSMFEVHLGSLACSPLASGNTKLTFSGPAGLSYRLLGSSDLEHWSELLTFMNTTETTSWTNPPSSPHRFYRAVTTP